MKRPVWVERPLDKEKYLVFLREGGLSPFLASYLARRGFEDLHSAYRFLFPRLEDFASPFLIPDMELAVKRLETALRTNERIGFYADSDADGILGAFILYDFLSKLMPEENLVVYFTDRLHKGYGFHPQSIPYFKAQGVSLILTIDVGVADGETVELAKGAGLDVIITDHHEFQNLPRTITITGKRSQCESLYHLCGAGVAFQLLKALRSYLFQQGFFGTKDMLPKLRPYLEIAGLATLADMVPLVGENRLITYFGFRELERSSFPALRALLSDLRYGITERDLQLSIIPRINACFRLGRPELFFNFLKEKDETKISMLLKEIDSLNEERKSLSASLWERVLERRKEAERESFVLLFDEGLPKGHLGVLAQRLKSQTGKPAIVLTADKNGTLVGSARSPEGLNLLALLIRREDLFVQLGGHALAFGLKIEKDRLGELTSYLEESLKGYVPQELELIYLDYEGRVSEFLEEENLLALRELPPYGMGHEPPMVLLKKFEVREIKPLKEKHCEIWLKDGFREVRGVFFNRQMEREPILLVCEPYINSFSGSLEFRVEDYKDELE